MKSDHARPNDTVFCWYSSWDRIFSKVIERAPWPPRDPHSQLPGLAFTLDAISSPFSRCTWAHRICPQNIKCQRLDIRGHPSMTSGVLSRLRTWQSSSRMAALQASCDLQHRSIASAPRKQTMCCTHLSPNTHKCKRNIVEIKSPESRSTQGEIITDNPHLANQFSVC